MIKGSGNESGQYGEKEDALRAILAVDLERIDNCEVKRGVGVERNKSPLLRGNHGNRYKKLSWAGRNGLS